MKITMTSQEALEHMLIERGMFESQAKEVIELSKPKLNDLVGNYKFTYDRPADEYPDIIYNLLFITIKPIALKWIEKNKPQAWFKPMFTN